MIDAEKVIQKSTQEMLKHHKVTVQLNVRLPDAVILVSHIQLALRHPEANSESSKMAREYAESIIGTVEKVSPDLADFMRLGFDKSHDLKSVQPPALGATDKFPEGKLNQDDQGELQFVIGHSEGNVVIDFGKQVQWLALPPTKAEELASVLVIHAREVAGRKVLKDADRFLMFFNLLDPTSPKPTESMDSLIKYFSLVAGWDHARTQMAFDECALRGWINKHD
jgi:hypothetical protein